MNEFLRFPIRQMNLVANWKSRARHFQPIKQ
uniref:Uncharacterized protein n=1 Tax=Rhizophora mucronata TaxID=61149 RepID=A0A2P2QIP2_RHIMU